MRILLRLKAIKSSAYDLKYFNKLQGVIYNLLRDTEYGILHNKSGYKFFCFSNIFPVGKALKKVKIPTLLLCGEKDEKVSLDEVKAIFSTLGSKQKKLQIIKNSDLSLNLMKRISKI